MKIIKEENKIKLVENEINSRKIKKDIEKMLGFKVSVRMNKKGSMKFIHIIERDNYDHSLKNEEAIKILEYIKKTLPNSLVYDFGGRYKSIDVGISELKKEWDKQKKFNVDFVKKIFLLLKK